MLNRQKAINENKEGQEIKETAKRSRIRYLTFAAIMAALITLMTAYICHIPVGVNGGYVHLGDTLIYLAATLLPTPYALAAAAIGGGLADLLTVPMWAPATIIIKILIALPFTSKSAKIITPRNVTAAILAYFISTFCYMAAEYVLFGSWPAILLSMSQSLVQSGGSAVLFVILGLALDKAQVKSKFMN